MVKCKVIIKKTKKKKLISSFLKCVETGRAGEAWAEVQWAVTALVYQIGLKEIIIMILRDKQTLKVRKLSVFKFFFFFVFMSGLMCLIRFEDMMVMKYLGMMIFV